MSGAYTRRRRILAYAGIALAGCIPSAQSAQPLLRAPIALQPSPHQQLEILQTHRTRAIRLFWVTLGFGVLAVLAAWLHTRTGAVRVVLNVLLGLAAVAVIALAVLAGDSGSRAVWGQA